MDAKIIKTTLKYAREAIRNKEFKEALKYCKHVLSEDKNNYNALVFVGVAAEGLEQVDQAVKAYKRAIDAAPTQLLAWQGLVGLYEKRPSSDHDTDLVNVYTKLQELLGSEKEKKKEVLLKLAKLAMRIGDLDKGVKIYQEMIGAEEDATKKSCVQTDLVDILVQEKSMSSEHAHVLMDVFRAVTVTGSVTFTDTKLTVTCYLGVLIKYGSVSSLAEECVRLHAVFPSLPRPLEILILHHMEMDTGPEMEDTIGKLKDLDPDNPYVSCAQGYVLLCQKNYIQARPRLVKAAESLKRVVIVHYCLSKVLAILHVNKEAQKACETCMSTIQRKDRLVLSASGLNRKLSMLQSQIDYRIGTQASLQRAMETLSQISESYIDVEILLGFIYVKAGELDQAKVLVSGTQKTAALDGWIQFHKGDNSGAILRLTLALEASPEDSESHLMLGRVQWAMWKEKKSKEMAEKSYVSFLKAAKLDPYNSEAFLYLGHFSQEVQQDGAKAIKCYQKAFDLNNDNEASGAALCDVLTSASREEEAYQILVTVTSKASAGSAKWAWLRLGLYQVQHDSASVAVTSFQSALRADPTDNHVWECLAEAYLHRGSLTAALKAFTKASELEPNSLYCLFQIAAIKQTLCMYTEAITEYKVILERSPNYVPALKGLGETYLLLARTHLTKSFHGRVRDNCEQGLLFLTRAASHRADMSCLWKLMGDACTLVHALCPQTFSITVDNRLVTTGGVPESCSIGLSQTLELGARCYGRALKVLPDCASLWHDLGVNLFHQSQQATHPDTISSLAGRAVNALKKALTLDARNHLHWNALGRIFCSQAYQAPEKAQHCFIKSIRMEPNNVVAWSNLATLYFKSGNIELAHDAFKNAQSLEPSYVACWIGQALIAETVGHEDAMDLFRHTTELANHGEGATGYASWVCTMLKDRTKHNTELFRYSIQQMAAIPTASDALAKYLDRVQTNPTAYNMYGLLLEHQGLYNMAATALHTALQLLDNNAPHIQEVRINYARILCKQEQYIEAVRQFDLVCDLLTLEDVCSKALALYKAGRYPESIEAYSSALTLADTGEERSHVSVALGMVHYRTGDLDTTKSVLFQSSQMTPPSRCGLLALCALGILQTDVTLTLAVLQELLEGTGSPSQTELAHLMSSANAVLENNPRMARNFVQQCIHKYPDQVELWRLLASVLVTHCHGNALVAGAATCAKVAHTLRPTLPGVVKLMTSGQLAGGHHSRTSRRECVMSSAQRAVHLNPDQIENWCNLASAIHATTVFCADRTETLTDVVLALLNWIILSFPEAPYPLITWCKKQRVFSLVGTGQSEKAEGLLSEMKSCGDSELADFAVTIAAVMSGDIGALSEQVMRCRGDVFLLEALLESCERGGVTVNLGDIFGENVDSHGRRSDFVCKILQAYYLHKQAKRTGLHDDAVLPQITALVDDILQLDSHCLPAMLVLTLASLSTNPRLAKHWTVKVSEGRALRLNKGDELSLTRRCLVKLMYNPRKESEALKKLLSDAEEEGDYATLVYYKVLCTSQ